MKLSAAGGTTEDLTDEALKPGWVYHLQHMTAYDQGGNVTQAALGFIEGVTFCVVKKRSSQDPFETVEWDGDITLKETDKIMVRFFNTTAG